MADTFDDLMYLQVNKHKKLNTLFSYNDKITNIIRYLKDYNVWHIMITDS